MKGYKAFEKGLICRGKQYAENTVFEEEKAEITPVCVKTEKVDGEHIKEDTFYKLVDGEFREVCN